MAKESTIITRMGSFMKENMIKEIEMEKVNVCGQMVTIMKVI